MQFKRVEIHGFKSFAEKYELFFHSGLTGIVGPNGCGKSNIVESIRWVMGENSARKMRGSEMDDVIFGGTQGRAKRNFAEVSLILDNSDFSAPEKFNAAEELIVTRRIERGTGSSYRINGDEVRARDVQLLFADLSAGAGSFGQVSQGRVAEIINQRPQERRQILEEAAGIRGLRVRRHEAELKLKQTSENLVRIDDIIQLLTQQNDSLMAAAQKAKEYRTLSTDIRMLHGKRLYAQYSAFNSIAQRQQSQLEKSKAKLASHQASEIKFKTELVSQNQAVQKLQETLLGHQASLKRYEIELENFDKSSKMRKEELQKFKQRLTSIESERLEFKNRENRAQAQYQQFQDSIAKLEAKESEPEDALEQLVEAQKQLQIQHQQMQAEMRKQTEKRAEEQAMLQSLAKEETELHARFKRLAQHCHEREQQLERTLAATIADSDKQLLEDALKQSKQTFAQAQKKRDAIDNQQLPEAEAKLRTARANLEQAQDNIKQQLLPMQEKMTRLSAQIETLSALFSTQDKDFIPIIDRVQAAEGFEIALGAVFGDDLQAGMEENAPIFWQETSLDSPALPLPQGVRSLSEFVKAPRALALRLSQIGVVFDNAAVEGLRAQMKQGQRLVTQQGDVWRWDGLRVRADAGSPVARRLEERNRLEALVNERGLLEEKLLVTQRNLEDKNASALSALTDCENEMQALQQKSREAHHIYHQCQNNLHEAERNDSGLKQKQAQILEKSQDLEAQLQNLRSEHQEVEQALTALKKRIAQASGKGDLSNLLDDLSDKVKQTEQLLREKNTEIEQSKDAKAMRTHQLASLQAQREEWQAHLESAIAQIKRLDEEARNLTLNAEEKNITPQAEQVQRQKILELIANADHQIQQISGELKQLQDKSDHLHIKIEENESNLRKMRESEIRIDEGQKINQQQLQEIIARIDEEFSITPSALPELIGFSADEKLPSPERLGIALREKQTLREMMGEVNLRADIEQIEIKERLDETIRQGEDLKSAITELGRGISHLNQEAEKHILHALDAVNAKFSDLFVRLFGGGRAMIKLDTPNDPLNAGLEIFASPPGKKLHHLSLLSGGEQALAALALIFAMFMVKPLPICILDEVDAPLDDDNVRRLCDLLDELARDSQTRFVIITHHRMSMSRCAYLYGVTMAEKGISRMVTVNMAEAAS